MNNTAINNISVIGAGAWGTAMANVLAQAGRNVTLYARDPQLADTITRTHENKTYLPGAQLHPSLVATSSLADAVKSADLLLLMTPAQHVRTVLTHIKSLLTKPLPLIDGAKGIEIDSGKLLSEVAYDILPQCPYAVLSGPALAHEVVKGLPVAVTLATTAPDATARQWAEALRGKAFRPYLSSDPVGAEVGGAIKNVIAIACGIAEGRGLGQNARAALMTRGIAEMKRYGMKKGAQAETFLGLSGIGDLSLTCNSMNSRNFSLGHELGRGKKLAEILAARKSVTEGIATARAIALHAREIDVDMPICAAVDCVLHDGLDIDSAIIGLLTRDLKNEVG